MKCKKCGFEGIDDSDDWITCPNCGAKYFNTNISSELSATKQIDEIENQITKKESENKGKNKKKEKKKKSKLRETVEFFIPIITAIMLALILKTFIFANAIVPTGSMISTINEGDRIIASRIAYIKSDPQRYDIILFKCPDDESQIFVKRVIGLPGEILEVVDGVAYVTGTDGKQRKTDQSFVKNQIPEGNYGPFYIPVKGETITTDGTNCFAENGMYVGGSNFINMYCTTDDSGNYVVAENCYFCMGDNRNSSWDSRFWDNTYVAENKIIGQAKFRYYPSFGSIE